MHLGAPWASKRLAWEVLNHLGTNWASTWALQLLFFNIFQEKCDLCISMPLSKGIAVSAGPGRHVGAAWVQKSPRKAPKWTRRARSEQPGQSSLAGRLGLAVNVMERTGPQPRCKSGQRPKSI